MKIDPKPKMTKTKQYRTDEEYLQMLSDRHPVIGMILEYRGLRKLLSTYVDALPQLVNPLTGRIHTSFNQAVTATGRLSSTNPNLQKYSDPRRPRARNPQGVHPVVGRPRAAVSRLFAGRTAADGAPERRPGDDRSVRARRGYPYRDGGPCCSMRPKRM